MDTLITLAPRDTSYVPLQMRASAGDILVNMAQVLINPNVRVKIAGSARVGRSGFSITVPVNYEGVQRIQLTHQDSAVTRPLSNNIQNPMYKYKK